MNYDVIVIGGGAAGLIAAHTSALYGKNTLLIERNARLGKKLLITGKGRCNITNNCDTTTFISNVVTNGKFMYGAVNTFTPADVIDYFENSGVPTKTERGNRVFPMSDKAHDVERTLEDNAKKAGVKFATDRVMKITTENGVVTGVLGESKQYLAQSVIVATGGKSYPLTGSTGDGYKLAQDLGHTIVAPQASLVPIVTKEDWCKEAQGLSLKNITVSLVDKKLDKIIYNELGEMLFTHFGVSGPLILSASAHIPKVEEDRYIISIDLKPALNEKQLDARILRDFSQNLNKEFANSLGALLPRKLIPIVIKLSGVPFDIKVNNVTKQMRENLLYTIKNLQLTVKEFRSIDEAIITCGGVDVKDISPKTMESKLVGGLYFAGEVIDVDAYTGGFNLQIAFSTGYVAGINA